MHKLKIISVLLISLTLLSCSDTIIDSPVVEDPISENSSKQKNIEGDIPITTITKSINGETGGVIHLTGIHIGPILNIVLMSSTLTIPPKAFKGVVDITVTADYETPGIIFHPHMEFKKPLELDLSYTGLDLLALQLFPGETDFGYMGNGFDEITFEPCEYEALEINLLLKHISVSKAKIKHFSRYGYSR